MPQFYFYNIPFTASGEEVMVIPKGKNIATYLAQFEVRSLFIAAGFSSSQDRIVLHGIDSGFYAANWMAVWFGTKYGWYFYWITSWETVQSGNDPDTTTLIAHITQDFMTKFLYDWKYKVEGFLLQATGTRTVIDPNEDGFGIIPRRLDYPMTRVDESFIRRSVDAGESQGFYLVVAFTTEDGAIQTAWIKAKSATTAEFIDECATIAAVSKIQLHNTGGNEQNIKISRIYAIPVRWTEAPSFPPFKEGPITWDLATANGNTWRAYFIEPTEGDFGVNVTIDLYGGSLSLMAPYSRMYLFTPTRVIELQDPTCRRSMAIVLGVGAEYGNDQISVTMILDGKTYDISDDFIIDFAINEQALWQEQHGQEVVLNKIAAAAGGVGGIVGGIASQNYFGAVQSLVSGVSSLVGVDSGLKDPAVQRGNGSFLTSYAQRSHVFSTVISVRSGPTYSAPIWRYVERYGYTLTEPVFVKFDGESSNASELFYPSQDLEEDESIGFFLRMMNVNVRSLPADYSAEAADALKQRLETGVRFVDPTKVKF